MKKLRAVLKKLGDFYIYTTDAIASRITAMDARLFPPPQIEFLTGENGVAPLVLWDRIDSPIRFKFQSNLFVQQMLHETSPGGVQTFEFDVWGKIPENYYAILVPIERAWSGGRLLSVPKYFRPGWSGEFTYTAFNAHPDEPSGLLAGQEGFELILSPIAGKSWLIEKS